MSERDRPYAPLHEIPGRTRPATSLLGSDTVPVPDPREPDQPPPATKSEAADAQGRAVGLVAVLLAQVPPWSFGRYLEMLAFSVLAGVLGLGGLMILVACLFTSGYLLGALPVAHEPTQREIDAQVDRDVEELQRRGWKP